MKRRSYLKVAAIILLIALLITLLVGLGFWQLSRANQKEALLAQLQQGQRQSVLESSALSEKTPQDLRFSRITLQGKFLNERTILLDNKTNNAVPGYHVFVPFSLSDGQLVLINRGWIPLGASRQHIPNPEAVKGEVTIEGYLDFAYRNPFINNALETSAISWPLRIQQLDLALIEQLTGRKLYKMLVILDKKSPFAFEPPTIISDQMPPARHRGYAFQWFSLAALLFLLSILSVRHFKGKA
ncbi:MAG: SURF1 family protein [Candidatus Berkiella sp.]